MNEENDNSKGKKWKKIFSKQDKHTQMDDGAYNSGKEKGTELMEKKHKHQASQHPPEMVNGGASTSSGPGTSTYTNTTPASGGCRPEICQAARINYQPPSLAGSPWHRKKTIYLVTIITSLIIWAVVYFTLVSKKMV